MRYFTPTLKLFAKAQEDPKFYRDGKSGRGRQTWFCSAQKKRSPKRAFSCGED